MAVSNESGLENSHNKKRKKYLIRVKLHVVIGSSISCVTKIKC